MKYKGIKFEKTDGGMYRIKLSSVYDNNCYEAENYDVEEKIFNGLDSLLREERHYDNADYNYLSKYSYDELYERNDECSTASPEDEYFSKLASCELREALCELNPVVYSAPTATLARSNSLKCTEQPHYHKIVHPLTKFHKHSLLNLTFCGENAPIKGKLP